LSGKEYRTVEVNTYPHNFDPIFAVIIPITNEYVVSDCIKSVYNTMVNDSRYAIEVVILLDGAINEAKEVIRDLGIKFPLKASLSERKRNYNGAIMDGLRLVSAPYVFFSDVNNEISLQQVILMKERLDQCTDKTRVIVNGRRKYGRKITTKGSYFDIFSKTFQKIISILFDLDTINDITSPFKLMCTVLAKDLCSECNLKNENFWIEFVARASEKNIRIVEVEVESTKYKNYWLHDSNHIIIPEVISQLLDLGRLKKELTGKNLVISIIQTKSIRRLITFAFVGASAAGLTLFFTWLGVYFHLFYLFSAAIAIQISIGWAFMLHDRVTFKDKIKNYNLRNILFRYLKYNMSSLGGEAINLSTLFILTNAGMFYLNSEMVAIVVAFMFNYTVSRKWVWKKEQMST
jgi:putative flippase GtrA